jgi:hypothetical protein
MTRIAFAHLLLGTVVTCAAAPSAAQTPQTPQTPAAPAAQAPAQAGGGAELYHVHFVKAAPGKLLELIDSYASAPQDPESSAPPVILRHREGDDWNLLVLRPVGPEVTLRAVPPSAELQQFLTKTRGLRAQHNDTFAIGPPWPEARKLILGAESAESSGGASGVYVVSVFRSLPGHRDQLEGVLKKIAAEEPGRTLMLQHLEGAPWEYVMIVRYDSWTAFGESEQKPGGQPGSTGLAMQEHLAEHHDTVAERVTRAAPARQP